MPVKFYFQLCAVCRACLTRDPDLLIHFSFLSFFFYQSRSRQIGLSRTAFAARLQIKSVENKTHERRADAASLRSRRERGPNSITHGSSSLVRRRILSFCISPAGAVLVCRPLFAEERIRRIRRVPVSANARVGVCGRLTGGPDGPWGPLGPSKPRGPYLGKRNRET